MVLILPYIEQGNAFKTFFPNGLNGAPVADGAGDGIVIQTYLCPSDPRDTSGGSWSPGQAGGYGLTSYVGVAGVDVYSTGAQQGIINNNYRSTRMAQIIDGTSNTTIVAERPFSTDLYWGWWDYPSCCDTLWGARNTTTMFGCPAPYGSPYNYGAGPNNTSIDCHFNYLWGPHTAGGNFLFADGSVHNLAYGATSPTVVAQIATFAGGETVQLGF